jgi:hypothetical protein
MKIEKYYLIINHFLLSKYIYSSLIQYPLFINLMFNTIICFTQKNKYFLLSNLIFIFLFFNPYVKTYFFFKSSLVNIVCISLRGLMPILRFIFNFIFVYFPLIDSFFAEFKILSQTNIVKICFFKFPVLLELNSLFLSFEFLYLFLNTSKFQLEFILKKKKNDLMNYNYLHMLKLPLLLK